MSDDPTSPAYVPTLFDHVKSPVKRKAERQFQDMSEQVCLKKGTAKLPVAYYLVAPCKQAVKTPLQKQNKTLKVTVHLCPR